MKYTLIRSKRRTLCLEIKNATLVVRAPFFYPKFKIAKFVKIKEDWIKKHLKKSRSYPRAKSSEVLIGGKLYYLEYKLSSSEKIRFKDNKVIILAVNKKRTKKVLKEFLLKKTEQEIGKLLAKYGANVPEESRENIKYRFYKSKWGSCTSNNRLSFNALLAMASVEIIKYVFFHEISHLKIKNHQRMFWNEVSKYDPNYKTHRKWLSQNRDMLKICV